MDGESLDQADLLAQLETLKEEHEALNAEADALAENGVIDQLKFARMEKEKKEHQRATTGWFPRRSPWPTKNEGKREMEKGENVKLSNGPHAKKRKRIGREVVLCATTEASIAADQPQRASQPAKQPAAAQKLHGRGRGRGR